MKNENFVEKGIIAAKHKAFIYKNEILDEINSLYLRINLGVKEKLCIL